ncbi:TPA: hypothetical protein N2D99_002150 [Clostridium botulinum]|nr:hypothetical protein [Clostridium botulinum]
MNSCIYELIRKNYETNNRESISNSIKEALTLMEDGEAKDKIYKALGLALGYTEYLKSNIAKEAQISKTAVQFLVRRLQSEEKIEIVKLGDNTFIKLKG